MNDLNSTPDAAALEEALRRSEERRQVLEELLRESARLATVGRIARDVAHEIANLLLAIQGEAFVAQEVPLARDVEAADGIGVLTERARELLRRVLQISDGVPEAGRPVSINATVAGLVSLISRLARVNAEVEVALGTVAPVYGKAADLELILINLCTNAIQAMPRPGLLRISTYARRASFAPDQEGSLYTVLEVKDSGVGIDPSARANIFRPRFSAEPGRRNGLGLTIVQDLVSSMQGRLELESEPGVGTVVRVFLPGQIQL